MPGYEHPKPRLTWAVLAGSLFLFLGACGGAWDKWVGTEEEVILPGDRISVLLHARALSPDPKLADADILLPPPMVNPTWPQAGGFANHAMHHLDAGDILKPAWRAGAGEGADDEERLVGSPIIAGGRVFTMDAESNVNAFDAATGDKLWETELTPEHEDDGHIAGGLAFENDRVFAATGFAQVIAMEGASGAIIWRQALGGPIRSAPTVRGGRVFAVTVDNKLYALDAFDGTTLWSHTGIAEIASLLGGASPAVDGGVVVAAYSSGELVALKVENGRLLWTDSLASMRRTAVSSNLSHIRGRPVIDRGRVFAASFGGLFVSIDLRSGRRIWDRQIASMESPWVAGDYIFVLTNDAEIVCLSRKDGRIYWVQTLPPFADMEDKEDPITWTGPVLVRDRLIVAGSHGGVLAVSPYTGRILGQEDLPDGVSVPPVVAGGSVYFLSTEAELLAYR